MGQEKISWDERFGYVQLNTHFIDMIAVIQLEKHEGKAQVRFAVDPDFDLETRVVEERAVAALNHGPKKPAKE